MLQHFLKIYFIFVFYIIFQNKCGISQENGTTETDILPHILSTRAEKCESIFCSCSKYSKLDGVYCDDGLGYDLPYIYFYRFKYLPARAFFGFRIKRMVLNDINTTVAENFLEGTTSLVHFEVRQSSIEIIPNFRTLNDTILEITIDSSRLTSLKGKNLQNLTSVTLLSFSNNYIADIDPNVFKGTKKVKKLDLSHNLLRFIPSKLLNPMKNLEIFSASHNNLLHVENLFSSTVPKFIHLEFNNITSTSSVMGQSKKDILKVLNSNKTFSKEFIKVLDLSHNFIKDFFVPSFQCSRSTFRIFERTITVEKLMLDGNLLQSLNICLSFYHISQMTVTGNKIQYLLAEDFVHKTDYLELQDNEIRRINRNTFQYIKFSLKYLDLSYNHITSINGSIRDLPRLVELRLNYNSIQTFEEDEFTGLFELHRLFLSNNQIKALGQLQRVQLPRLLQMNIENNSITFIRPDRMRATWRTLKFLGFEGNPFKCDCHLQPLLDWLKGNKSIETDTNVCLRSNLSPQKSVKCPDICSCKCSTDGDASFIFVDCSSRNLTVVPHFLRKDVTQMGANQTFTSDDGLLLVTDETAYPSYIEDRVLGINLTNNSIASLDEAQLLPNLTQLYLSNNKLSWLPESILDNQLNLKNVSLSGNPWICNCSTLKFFKKWLTSKINIHDFDNIRCGISEDAERNFSGRVIWELTDFDLCPITEQLIVVEHSTHVILTVTMSLAFVIFCLAAKILYTKYELNFKVFLYYHGFTYVKEKYQDYNKAFDAFVSFSHDDDEFVIKEIVSVIEDKDPNIHLCLHYRNFWPGKLILDNITTAVRNSKMTVIILSRNFLDSDWCMLEFRIALSQVMEDNMHRIIVVKLGDLPKEICLPIKVYLESTTYLTWGEKRFWNKLLYILPSRNSVSSEVPRTAGSIELILTRPFSDRFQL